MSLSVMIENHGVVLLAIMGGIILVVLIVAFANEQGLINLELPKLV